MHLDEPGAQLEMTEREDGVVEMRSVLPVPAEERWFWEEGWQSGERSVGEHVAAGHESSYETDADFLDSLSDA